MATTKNLEEAAMEAFQSVGESCEEYRQCCEDKIREAPLASVATAAAVGFLVHILPVTAIVGSVVRIALFLLKPALLVFGALKLYEVLQAKNSGGDTVASLAEPLIDSPPGPSSKKSNKS